LFGKQDRRRIFGETESTGLAVSAFDSFFDCLRFGFSQKADKTKSLPSHLEREESKTEQLEIGSSKMNQMCRPAAAIVWRALIDPH
jgi:hypothetical protein